jgi:hypothetical protein
LCFLVFFFMDTINRNDSPARKLTIDFSSWYTDLCIEIYNEAKTSLLFEQRKLLVIDFTLLHSCTLTPISLFYLS